MSLELKMLWKDGKKKALTLSFDDGTIYDRRFVELLNKYGIKGTFNLNSGIFDTHDRLTFDGVEIDFSRIAETEVKDLYAGHEVASHTMTHPSLTDLTANMAALEVAGDRTKLEELTGDLVRGFAYPYGTFNKEVEGVLAACGIEHARTVCSTHNFELPADFLEWHPTCHQEDLKLMELTEAFCENRADKALLFYVWGHSYEFKVHESWDRIEEFLQYVFGYKEEIAMLTNIEIVDYVKAFRRLLRSTDGNLIYNPSAADLWFEKDGKTYCVHAGERLYLK